MRRFLFTFLEVRGPAACLGVASGVSAGTGVDVQQVVLLHCLLGGIGIDFTAAGEHLKCTHHHRVAVDLEVPACSRPRVRETEVVRTKGGEFVRQELADLSGTAFM